MTDILTIPRPRRTDAPTRPAPEATEIRDAQGDSADVSLIAICTLLLGGWLLFSHFILGYPSVEGAEDAFFNEALAGVIVLSAGYGRLCSPHRLPKLTALQTAVGGWLMAAPWVVAYGSEVPAARTNDVACGALAVLLAALAAVFAHRSRRTVPADRLVQAQPDVDLGTRGQPGETPLPHEHPADAFAGR